VSQNASTGYERTTPGDLQGETGSTKDVAKEQAAGVASSATEAGQHVAGVAKDQAGEVAAEAGRQAKDVFGQATNEVSRQAAEQQQRVAGGLRSLGTELGSMAERSDEAGMATDLARQAASTVHSAADWLEQREPGELLEEVKTFARRRPGMFLAVALGAGLAAGRLTRGLKDEASSSGSATTGSAGSAGYSSTGTATPTSTGSSYSPTPAVPPAGAAAGVGTLSGVGSHDQGEPFDATYTETEIVEVVEPSVSGTPGYYNEETR